MTGLDRGLGYHDKHIAALLGAPGWGQRVAWVSQLPQEAMRGRVPKPSYDSTNQKEPEPETEAGGQTQAKPDSEEGGQAAETPLEIRGGS